MVRGFLKYWRVRRGLGAHFDADFYRSQDATLADLSDDEALEHYYFVGWRADLDPVAWFSGARYLEVYEDVAQSGVNPFHHYLRSGRKEGRSAAPRISLDDDLDLLCTEFDAAYYRAACAGHSILDQRRLAEHYLTTGWKDYLDPAPGFSVAFYLERHADVRAQKGDPYLHYLRVGRAENRAIRPGLPHRWQDLSAAQVAHLLTIFDAEYYRAQSPEASGEARALLEHYVTRGWRAGLDPSRDFSNSFYRKTYPDCGRICPLVHFAFQVHGEARQGRADVPRSLVFEPGRTILPHLAFPLPGEDLPRSEPVPDAPLRSDMAPDPLAEAVPAVGALRGLDLHWVVPDFARGGGGHMTIFRIIRHLESFGHRCTIWIDRPFMHKDMDAAYQDLIRHFQCVGAELRFVSDGLAMARGDALIATGWATAYIVEAAKGFAGKFYFVQDYEPEFYPTGSDRYLAEQTYGFDLACICASPWLQKIMHDRHGRWSRGFHLAYDAAVYTPRDNEAESESLSIEAEPRFRIAVYAREHTARRSVHLAVLALARLAQTRDDFEVQFFGQDHLSFHKTAFHAVNHGVLSDHRLAALYRDCDLALCFSATNYSLVPQEMMACGLPLIELDGESTRAIFPPGVVRLAGPDPRDICGAIESLLDDRAARRAQAAAAMEWVAQFSWQGSARTVEAALLEYLEMQGAHLPAPTVASAAGKWLDVVIPTYNGMTEIAPVIEALRRQSLFEAMQIHCIDSSSGDGTTEWLRAQPDIALTVIDKSDFQHGRTRNQGAALGKAPLIAFLTQDAVPAGPDWAGDILRMMRHYPQAAGLFGRHLPYPAHSPFVRHDITQHFDNLLTKPLAVSRDTDRALWESGDRAWRQFLHFYSDNNSAMRRAVWSELPYPEIDYGEDQVWARDMIEAGHTKLYAPTASVYHSHDYDPEEAYERSRVEGAFFYTHFGYELGEGTREALDARLDKHCQALLAWGLRHGVAQAEILRQQAVLGAKYRGWRDGRIAAMSG